MQQQPDANLSSPQQGGSGGTHPIEATAIEYIDKVIRELDAHSYNEFMSIMNKFKKGEIDTSCVIWRISNLFFGHAHLALEFNLFLPDGCKIGLKDVEAARKIRQDMYSRIWAWFKNYIEKSKDGDVLARVLKSRQKRWAQLVPKIEADLRRIAPSRESYADISTLGQRIRALFEQIFEQDNNELRRKKFYMERINDLHHASQCTHEDTDDNDNRCRCTNPRCSKMKSLWKHMPRCADNNCRVSHCVSSRNALFHYHDCKNPKCPYTAPMRRLVKNLPRLPPIYTISHSKDMPPLTPEELSIAFGYIDVHDVPAVARTSKEWGRALKSIEDTLWLSFVQRHRPVVEKITNLLPSDIVDNSIERPPSKRVRTEDGSPAASSLASPSAKMPAPSKNLKSQFQRAHIMASQDIDETSIGTIAPEAKPLSAYFFQVDLILYDGPDTEVGVISRIVNDVSFNEHGRIDIPFNGEDERRNYDFESYRMKIYMFEKATGRQAILYNSDFDKQVLRNIWRFQFVRVMRAFPTFPNPMEVDLPCIGCTACIYKDTCSCLCDLSQVAGLFMPPRCNRSCCHCEKKWECCWNMRIELHIDYTRQDEEDVGLDVSQQLWFLAGLKFS